MLILWGFMPSNKRQVVRDAGDSRRVLAIRDNNGVLIGSLKKDLSWD